MVWLLFSGMVPFDDAVSNRVGFLLFRGLDEGAGVA